MINSLRLILFFWAFFTYQNIFSQSAISQHVFAVAGHSHHSGLGKISSTLGECFIYGSNLTDPSVCQGFQSGQGLMTTSLVDIKKFQLHIQYFPNPVTTGFTIQWEEPGDYIIEIRNVLGQLISSRHSTQHEMELYFDLEGHAGGLYGIFIKDVSYLPVFAGWITLQRI